MNNNLLKFDSPILMESTINRNILSKVYGFFSTRVVYHATFWLIVFIILVIFSRGDLGLGFTITFELINILFYIIIVYFNLIYLIPNYLNDKNFLTYCGLLLVSVLILTPIKIFILYFLFSPFPEIQQKLITHQYWYFFFTFMIAGSSTIFKIVTDWVRYQRDRRELQTQTMQSELRFLKSQINPHFLFNTLNNLYALTLKKSDKAPEIVIKLSEMMRYMLYECNERRVSLSKEVNYIRNYLDLERLRQGENVEIKFEITGKMNDQKIAPLMFIPFLENSFKHGLNNHLSTGFVTINLNVEEKRIQFDIENSKAESLPATEHRRSGGIGLVNVRRRLNLLYPDHYQLEIRDNPKSYGVFLNLDLD